MKAYVSGMSRARRKTEGGFALLVVFLFAAAVAFTMYLELPRAAFESARDKEQLLMDRGNQYKRAIEVYYAVNKRYPPELKDLENTNEKRYLRRRYKDPLTGEDEWRLIHSNGSFLTDSLVTKPPAQNANNGTPANGPGVGAGPLGANIMNTATASAAAPSDVNNGGAAAGLPQPVNAAVQRRPSDRTFTPAGGFPQPGNPQAPDAFGANPFGGNQPGANTANLDPNDPRTWPPITLATPTQPNGRQPGQQPNTQNTPAGGFNGGGFNGGGFNGSPLGAQNGLGQPVLGGFPPSTIPGQSPGLGGANPQPAFFDSTTPTGSNPLPGGNPIQNQFNPNQFNGNQFNGNQIGVNPVGQVAPQANQPGQLFNPGQPFNPGAGLNQPFNQPVNQQFNQQPAVQFPQGRGGAQPQTAVANPAGAANPALGLINDQLFRPNQAATAPGVANASPGIAGVASKHEGPSIMTYRERTKYQEWEFVFDPSTKGPNQANPNQRGQTQPGQNQGLPGQGQQGAPNLFGQPLGQPFGQPTGQPFGQPTGQPFGQPTGLPAGQPQGPFGLPSGPGR